jgi:uncharacterized membrane protein YgcG
MTSQPPRKTESPMAYLAGQTISRAAAGASAVAGAKAGKNYHDLTGDVTEAAWRGAIAARRWFVWGLSCVAWCVMVLITFCIMMGMGVDYQDYQQYHTADTLVAYHDSQGMFFAWLVSLPIIFIFILVLYKRNIDFGLHKRHGVYDLGKTFAPLFAWAPNWLLYAGFVIVPVGFQFIF